MTFLQAIATTEGTWSIVAGLVAAAWLVAALVPSTRPHALRLWWLATAAALVLLLLVPSVVAMVAEAAVRARQADEVARDADALQSKAAEGMRDIVESARAAAAAQSAELARRRMETEAERSLFAAQVDKAMKLPPAARRARLAELVEGAR